MWSIAAVPVTRPHTPESAEELAQEKSQQHMKAGPSTDTAALVKAAEGCKFGWSLPRVNDGV